MRRLLDVYRTWSSDRFDEKRPWHRALRNCLRGKEPGHGVVSLIVDEIREQTMEGGGPRDYVRIMKHFAALALMRRCAPNVVPLSLLRSVHSTVSYAKIWEGLQTGEGPYALGTYLAGLPAPEIEPRQSAQGAVFPDTGKRAVDGAAFYSVPASDLALVWLFLGRETKNRALETAAVRSMLFALPLFDRTGMPFFGIGTREEDFDPTDFLSSYVMLFSACSPYVTSNTRTHARVTRIMHRLTELLHQSIPSPASLCIFRPFLALAIDAGSDRRESGIATTARFDFVRKEGENRDPDTGRITVSSGNMDLACLFVGVNTGIGALHKGSIRVVSFGPHFAPLADCSRYGQYRSVPDVEYEQTKETFLIKGWVRPLSGHPSRICMQNMTMTTPGDSWLRFTASGKGGTVLFTAKLLTYDEEDAMYFVYFVSADEAHVGKEDPLFPGTLDRYRGECKRILFTRGEDRLLFTFKRTSSEGKEKEGSMEVIPLAEGNRHFWGADFLVALPFYRCLEKHISLLS